MRSLDRATGYSRRRGAMVWILLLASASCLACGPRQVSHRRPKMVVLISLDTFRADLLALRRKDGSPLLPNLAELRATSLRFEDAMATMAYTLPSHMTMLTGMHHESHYVVTEKSRLAPTLPTLGEGMRAAGFKTVGIFTSHFLKAAFGFDRGFDVWRELPVGLTCAERVSREAVSEIDLASKEARPLFLFVHYFEAHSDFDAEGNRLPYYSPADRRTDLAVEEADLCDELARCATDRLLGADREKRPEPPERLALVRDLYTRGAVELDAWLGELFSTLKERGLWEDTLLVLTADHGEEFREHGMFLHSQVFDESLRVPLLFHWPARLEPGADSRLVGLESVAPSLLRAVGATPPALMEARDLLAPTPASEDGSIHVSQDKLFRTRFGLRTEKYLLVWDFSDSSSQLFDRGSDPGETRDLAASRPELVVELRSRLFAALRHYRRLRPELSQAAPEVFSEKERRTLRSLGYL